MNLLMVFVVAILAYGALLFWSDADATFAAMGSLPLNILILSILLSIGNFVLRAGRWRFYLYRLGIRIGFIESLLIFLAGFSMTLTPGKVGEVIKSYLIKETHGVSMARTAPIIVAERTTDLAALVLMLAVGSLPFRYGLPVAVVGGVAVLLFIAVCTFDSLGNFFINIFSKLPYLKKFTPIVRELYATLCELSGPAVLLPAIVVSTIAWSLQGLCLLVIADAIVPSSVDVLTAMFVYAMPLLAGTLAMLPGGLGLAEGSMSGILTALPDIKFVNAAAITILVRLVTLWLAIVIGFLALLLWRFIFASRSLETNS